MKRKKQRNQAAGLERWLVGGVSVLAVGFLVVATVVFVRALQLRAQPVDERVTAQAEVIQQTAEAVVSATAQAGGEATPQFEPVIVPTSEGVAGLPSASATPDVNPEDLPADGPTPTTTFPAPTGGALPTTTPRPVTAAVTSTAAGVAVATNTLAPSATLGPTATPMASPIPPTATRPATSGGNLGLPPAPGPSPTWGLYNIPTPAPASGPSKLGFHITLSSGGVVEFAAAVRPAVMKGVEDIGVLRDIKAVSPGTMTIGRFIVDEWQTQVGVGDPSEQAIAFVESQLERYEPHRAYVDYWEGYNEVTANPHVAWYAQFEATRACEMQKYGYRAAIGGFSTGTPEPWEFELFLPAIEAGIRCGAILHLHEYGAPTYYLWWGEGIPSVPGNPHYPDRGPLAGRYRWFYRDYLIPQGLVIPLVISEAGVDGLVAMAQRPEATYTGPGWLNFRDFWVQQGLTNDPTRFYVDQLIWYDSLLRQDSYVIGATIYTIAGGCCPQQATYEAADTIPLLTQYMQSLR